MCDAIGEHVFIIHLRGANEGRAGIPPNDGLLAAILDRRIRFLAKGPHLSDGVPQTGDIDPYLVVRQFQAAAG
ncbi:hypothetical protein WK81_28150 [Burkholderia ubonensis]|nr:hypothetical protein WK81_28150 [Burkholderia ubonensis]